jgi:hypothetical protein
MDGIFYSTRDMLQKSKGRMVFVPAPQLGYCQKGN